MRRTEWKRQCDIEGGEDLGDDQVCRICFQNERPDTFIKPCLCTALVHRECLDEWRAQEQFPRAFTHCPTCRFQYQTILVEDNPQQAFWAKWRFRFFVARDMGGIFLGVQLFIMCLAKLVHLIDSQERVKELYPHSWVEDHSSPMAIGPYYCSAAILFFALVGLFEALAFMGCWSPVTSLHRPSGRRHQDCCNEDCCRAGTGCADCCSGADCCHGATASGGGDAAAACGAIVLFLVVVLAVLGVFVCIFFGTIVLQQAVQRHLHLLAMRAETKRTVVRDLAGVPQETLQQGAFIPPPQTMDSEDMRE